MQYHVIAVEKDARVLDEIIGVIRHTDEFDLVAYYTEAKAAIKQSRMFSPDIILVSIDEPEMLGTVAIFRDMFIEAKIIALLDDWKTNLADNALRYGATGCMVKGFKGSELKYALEMFERRGKSKPARTMAFFSPKGNGGRSTFLSRLAVSLAEKSGEAVAIIDADLQFGDLPIMFDVDPTYSVVEAVRDIKLLSPLSFANYYKQVGHNVWLLSGTKRPEYAELVEQDGLIEVIRMTGHLFRYILVDLPAGFSPISIGLCEQLDTAFIISMMRSGFEVEHMKHSMSMFKMWSDYGKKVYPIFTDMKNADEAHKREMEQELGYEILDLFPHEEKLIMAANCGRMGMSPRYNNLFDQKINKLAEMLVKGRR
ncbi:MAG: P-loop NTPase [Selenomonas sp.]|uniref:P-loop NTPase n=1 Tax=Selenomonas sp. TaxID=2053611 RepID=UPI0025ECE2E6|nr:P-loop NTPase [Selenomonas sp.]MCR5757743.1 P-loop NTPase [Selenomonas sp.]